MSLVPPILDDRRFDDLRKEALARVQREFPEWTDHNASDPGVTLLELFAWFTELMLFRMNQLPDKLHGELLSLLGVRPTPAQAATAIIEFRLDPPDGALDPKLPDAIVTRRTQSERISLGDGKDVVFETEEELALVRRPLVALRRRYPRNGDFHDVTLLNGLANRGFDPFGPAGTEGCELRLRIKVLPDDQLSDVFPEIFTLHAALAEPVAGGAASVTEKPQLGQPSAAELVWEGRLADADGTADKERWERLETIVDETAAFARDGFIRIGRPRRAVAHGNESGKYVAFELRCRVAKPFAFGRAPRLWHLAINAVTAHAYGTEKQQDLGASNGLSGQFFTLRKQPVEPGSVRLITGQEGRDGQISPDKNNGGPWIEAADFSLAGPHPPDSAADKANYHRRAYMVDPDSGRITFGDGEYGEIPKAGERVVVLTYRSGGGAPGNVNAGAIKFSKPPKYSGVNPLPASGGRDAESAGALRQRAPARLRSRDRAVTAHDYEAIACAEGGMARAQAVSGLHPDFPELEGQIPGALTVFVVAPLLKDNRAPPWPGNPDLERVESEFETRRMIGSEVHVRAAQIVPVKVTVTIRRASGVGAENAKAAIRTAINAWLNDEARGFGTRIYATEIWSAIVQARSRDTRVVNGIISLHVKIEGRGELNILPSDDDQDDPKIAVLGATADAKNVSLRLPDHAVPWGGEDHVVGEVPS